MFMELIAAQGDFLVMSEQNVLAALTAKKNTGVARVEADVSVQGTGEDVAVVLRFPLRELEKARAGKGKRAGVGFELIPVEFRLPDGSVFLLASPWMSITA